MFRLVAIQFPFSGVTAKLTHELIHGEQDIPLVPGDGVTLEVGVNLDHVVSWGDQMKMLSMLVRTNICFMVVKAFVRPSKLVILCYYALWF